MPARSAHAIGHNAWQSLLTEVDAHAQLGRIRCGLAIRTYGWRATGPRASWGSQGPPGSLVSRSGARLTNLSWIAGAAGRARRTSWDVTSTPFEWGSPRGAPRGARGQRAPRSSRGPRGTRVTRPRKSHARRGPHCTSLAADSRHALRCVSMGSRAIGSHSIGPRATGSHSIGPWGHPVPRPAPWAHLIARHKGQHHRVSPLWDLNG